MSSRPGRVAHAIVVDLPRPRTFESITVIPEYVQYVREVRHALNAGAGAAEGSD